MPVDKREARRQFKLKKIPRGVFAIRCSASNQVWVSGSRDLNASHTGAWFMLRLGSHHNKQLQTAWNTHGANAFHYEILEQFDDDLAPMLLNDSLRDRQKHWLHELGASAI